MRLSTALHRRLAVVPLPSSVELPSIQHHSPLQAAGEVADAVGAQDVVSERLAGRAQLGGDVRLLSQVLARQPGDLREPPDRGRQAGHADLG